jgi:hypothetical protein
MQIFCEFKVRNIFIFVLKAYAEKFISLINCMVDALV